MPYPLAQKARSLCLGAVIVIEDGSSEGGRTEQLEPNVIEYNW